MPCVRERGKGAASEVEEEKRVASIREKPSAEKYGGTLKQWGENKI